MGNCPDCGKKLNMIDKLALKGVKKSLNAQEATKHSIEKVEGHCAPCVLAVLRREMKDTVATAKASGIEMPLDVDFLIVKAITGKNLKLDDVKKAIKKPRVQGTD